MRQINSTSIFVSGCDDFKLFQITKFSQIVLLYLRLQYFVKQQKRYNYQSHFHYKYGPSATNFQYMCHVYPFLSVQRSLSLKERSRISPKAPHRMAVKPCPIRLVLSIICSSQPERRSSCRCLILFRRFLD